MQKRLFGILTAAAIIVAACGGATNTPAPSAGASTGTTPSGDASAPPEGGLAAEQILRIDISGEPATLDPNKASSSDALAVIRALHRPLVYYDKDLKVVPSLAESWEISEDAKTFTFTLRDAKYSNGDPIVAADLVYSWRRVVDPRTAADYGYVMSDVAGGNELLAMAGADPAVPDADIDAALENFGVSAPDDKTFVVQLAVPATYFLAAMTLWVGVPIQEKWITMEGATEAANYVSSGPFMMDTWDHNSQIILKPNPNWYGDVKPTLTELHMSMITDVAARLAAYETGEIDMMSSVPGSDIERIKADPVLSTEYSEQPGLSYTYYNFANGNDTTGKAKLDRCVEPTDCPTANKNFRIALTQAIDKQALIAAAAGGLAVPGAIPVMPGLPGYDASIDPYPYDLDAAQASMAKALEELGVATAADLPPLKIGFNTEGTHADRVAFLAEAWRQAFGLVTEQIGSEFPTFIDQRHLGVYDISRNGWGADYPHANNQLSGLFTCGGGNNDSQYCNPAFDDLLVQAAAEPDQDKQAALYVEAQTLMMADAPFLSLYYPITPNLIKPYVAGLVLTAVDSQNPGEQFYETISILEH